MSGDRHTEWHDWPPPDDPRRPPRRWYGWQTLAVDASAVGMVLIGYMTAAASRDTDGATRLAAAGVATYLGGAPVVHAANGHVGSYLASAGLRAGSAALLQLAAAACESEDPACAGAASIALLSVPAAIAIDSAVIAREDVPKRGVALWTGPWKSLAGSPRVGGGMQVSF